MTAAQQMTAYLERRIAQGEPTTVTWFNHYSVRRAIRADVALCSFDLIAIDGLLLMAILRQPAAARSSADLVLPQLLPKLHNAKVGVIGATPKRLQQAVPVIRSLLSDSACLALAIDGFTPRNEWMAALSEQPLDLLIIGTGAPLQDIMATQVAESAPRPCVVLTCGGWIDQVADPDYYPIWAYRLRLNWLVRLAREPRRLWRRYSIEAAQAVAGAARIRAYLRTGRGFASYFRLVNDGSTGT